MQEGDQKMKIFLGVAWMARRTARRDDARDQRRPFDAIGGGGGGAVVPFVAPDTPSMSIA